jgi:hypothetical protein
MQNEAVMAGLVSASRVYPICAGHSCESRASLIDANHAFLFGSKTWMPATSAGMTRQGA